MSSFEGRLAALLSPSSGCIKAWPNVKLWRPLGKLTWTKLWLNWTPNVQLWRPLGKIRCSVLWLKAWPNVNLCRPLGNLPCSKLLWKSRPNVKLWRPLGKDTSSKLYFSTWIPYQSSSLEDQLESSLDPSFGWNGDRMPSFEGRLAKSLAPSSGQTNHQMSTFVGLLATSLAPSSFESHDLMSSFEGHWARTLPLSSTWIPYQSSSLEDQLNCHSIQVLVEMVTEGKALKAAWQSQLLQSGRTYHQMSSFEGRLAASLSPSSG